MIHEAYMPVYMGSRFSLRTGGRARGFTRGNTRGPRGPKKKRGSKIQAWVDPPPHSGNARKKTFFSIEVFPLLVTKQ